MRFYYLPLLLQISNVAAADEVLKYDSQILPLVQKYCVKCHNEEKSQGDLNLAKFTDLDAVKQNKEVWGNVYERIRIREMPPDTAPQLTEAEFEIFIQWIAGILK